MWPADFLLVTCPPFLSVWGPSRRSLEGMGRPWSSQGGSYMSPDSQPTLSFFTSNLHPSPASLITCRGDSPSHPSALSFLHLFESCVQ